MYALLVGNKDYFTLLYLLTVNVVDHSATQIQKKDQIFSITNELTTGIIVSLGENETKNEITLSHWSVAQAGSNDEKNWGSKISLDCPSNTFFFNT